MVQAQSGNVIPHGSAQAWANLKNYAGPVDPNTEIGFRVYLGWNNPTAAVALAQAVSDPGSSSYRQYLTPEQFRQQFAPSKAQVAAVQSWLESKGFTLNYTPKNNHYVSAQGTVGQAQAAFATQFAVYNVKGKTVRSPSADGSIPSSLASTVIGVVDLHESGLFLQPDHVVDTDAPPTAA